MPTKDIDFPISYNTFFFVTPHSFWTRAKESKQHLRILLCDFLVRYAYRKATGIDQRIDFFETVVTTHSFPSNEEETSSYVARL